MYYLPRKNSQFKSCHMLVCKKIFAYVFCKESVAYVFWEEILGNI